jgi:hypothetical protein
MCHGIYNPNSDRQRFCQKCKTWYHLKCLERSSETMQSTSDRYLVESFNEELEMLCVQPIERGAQLGIIGNGRVRKTAYQIYRAAIDDGLDPNPNWKREINDKLIILDPDYYTCPRCTIMM